MKAFVNLLFAAAIVPAFLLAPSTSASSQNESHASAETIHQAVTLAHSRAREAGGRPGPLRTGR